MQENSGDVEESRDSRCTFGAKSWEVLQCAAREGDGNALDMICRTFRDYLLVVVSSQLGDDIRPKVAASDLVQNTLIEVCQDFRDFRGTSEREFRAWLRKLVAHNVVDASRRYRRSQRRKLAREVPLNCSWAETKEVVSKSRSASSELRRKEVDENLLDAIGRLSEKKRKIIELRHKEGMSHAEVAARLGISEMAARKAWSRAIATLREELARGDVT